MDNSGRTGPQRQAWSDSVHIREVGGPAETDQGYSSEASPPESGPAAGITPRPPRRDRPFRAAWILTGIMLGIGLLGIGGAFEDSRSSYAFTHTVDPDTGRVIEPEQPPLAVQMRNLGYTSPMMFQTGLASASALLIIRGLRKSRAASASAADRLPPN